MNHKNQQDLTNNKSNSKKNILNKKQTSNEKTIK